jgi:hypothetical protein
VSCVSLYEGAFVHIGAVHDGWVPIQDNDWYYIRDFIKVGMHVQVEVIVSVFCHQLFVCVLLMLLVGSFTVL